MTAALLAVASLLGQPVPEWPEKQAERWVQGEPRDLEDLRGKVVLVRFFTESSCPYCSETAPALRELHRDFGPRGLVVIGVYTPKPEPRPVEAREALDAARGYGFDFPIVVDDDWAWLRALWLDRVPGSAYTSASLLIDRRGVLRHVQEGGAYSRTGDEGSRRDFRLMREAVAKLVSER